MPLDHVTVRPRSALAGAIDISATFDRRNDNKHCLVDTYDLTVAGVAYSMNLILPHAAPPSARWLIGSVTPCVGRGGWIFKEDSRVLAGFQGIAFPHAFEGTTYVLYVANKFRLVHVVPLVHLLQRPEQALTTEESARVKRAISPTFGFAPQYSEAEAKDVLTIEEASLPRVLMDRQGNRRLMKVLSRPGGHPIRYEIVTFAENGAVVATEKLETAILNEARKHFGHVPVAPTVPGGRTNVPGRGPAKGLSGGGGGKKNNGRK